MVLQKVPVNEWCSGMGHGEGGRMVVPALMREGDPEPDDDGLIINFCYSVNNTPSDSAPRFGRCAIALEEHTHVEGQELYCHVDAHGVNYGIIGEEIPKKTHIWACGQGSTNNLRLRYVDGGDDMMLAHSDPVYTYDGATCHLGLRYKK